MCAQAELYLSDPAEALDPLASPLMMPENVMGSLPPTFFGYSLDETLKDQNEAMLAKMEKAGVTLSVKTYAGIHCSILWMTGAPAADYYKEVATFIKKYAASPMEA